MIRCASLISLPGGDYMLSFIPGKQLSPVTGHQPFLTHTPTRSGGDMKQPTPQPDPWPDC